MTSPLIKRFLVSLKQNNLLGILTFLVALGGAGVVALQEPPPPQYRADGAIAFSSPPPSFTATGEQLQALGREVSEEMLLADRVLTQVSETTKISKKEILSKVRIRFPQKDEPQVIGIRYTGDEGQKAGVLVASLMQAMVEHSRWLNTFRLQDRIDKINQRLPKIRQELKEAEDALERYNRQEGVALLAVKDGSLVQRITGSQQEQDAVVLRLEELNTQIQSLENRLSLSAEQAYTSSALSADPIIADVRAQIFQLETQLESLAKDYKPEHPSIIQLRQQLQASEQLLQNRAAEVLRSDRSLTSLSQIRSDSTLSPATQQLANSLVALQIERDTLLRRLVTIQRTEQELRREYEDFPNKQFQQNRLAEQVALKQDLFTRMQTALADAQAAEAETVGSLSIASPPTITPQITKLPNPVLVMAGGGAFGLLAGAGVIFVLSTLDNKLYTTQEIKSLATERDVSILGELPLFSGGETSGGKIPVLQGNNVAYLPIYERFRSNLRRLNRKTKVVLITSVERYEGKTITAYNLAIASAHSGKRTLLMEADLRSPSKAESLGVPVDSNAIIEPLRYYNSRSDCIRLVPEIENLYIVPSAGPQSQAAGIVESGELKRLIQDAQGRFDLVVIDTPPISKCNDALLLEPLTDGLVIVTRPDYSKKSLLEAVLDEMTEIEEDEESPLLGVVINGVEQPFESPVFLEEKPILQPEPEGELLTEETKQPQGGGETPIPLG